MRNTSTGIAAALLVILSHAAASQTPVIDQQNLSPIGNWVFSTDWYGQSFKPSASTSAGAGILFDNTAGAPPNGSLKMELWKGIPGAVGSFQVVGPTGATVSTLPGSGMGYVDVFWESLVSVDPGATYFIGFRAFGPSLQLHMEQSGDGYANGQAYFNSSHPSDMPHAWGTMSNFDFRFREFSDGPVTGAPEPGSLALIATGAAVLAMHGRRRKTGA